jgi:hypothetical protein
MSTILDYYKYAALATAAYVRMGTAELLFWGRTSATS